MKMNKINENKLVYNNASNESNHNIFFMHKEAILIFAIAIAMSESIVSI